MIEIHQTAVVSPRAEIAESVAIGPYSVIGEDVWIGEECVIGPHTVIEGPTTIGRRNRFFGQASVGTDSQDLKYRGDETFLIIGDDNVIREFVTINRGTAAGGTTSIGNRNLLMTGVHIAHDCCIGEDAVMANAATLAGHVDIGDGSIVGAFSGVHQFCQVGKYAFVGGYSVLTQDALPFVKTVGERNQARIYGINSLGLQRKGFSAERIRKLKQAYRCLFQKDLKTSDAIARIREEGLETEEVRVLIEFIRNSKRGFVR